MSRIKFILFWLVTFCVTNLSFGQQDAKPTNCITPGGGILVGGAFTVSPQIGCLDFTKNSATAAVSSALSPTGGTNFTSLGYKFNYKDGDNFAFPPTIETSRTFTQPGTYWIMQGMNVNSINYVTCNSFELIQTEQPDIGVSSCGTNAITLTFLSTPKNKKHTGYRILWGDGMEDNFAGLTATSFPFNKAHTYATPPSSKPLIQAIYARGALDCKSTPFEFSADVNNKPFINELEGLNGGESNKITMINGSEGKAYTLEQKPKTGNWADTGKKITRASGSTSVSETVTGLNGTNEYCFRLKTIDACNNPIMSNEVCTIIPKATVVSSKEVKIDWNSPDPAVTRYVIGYRESPTGLNPNTASPVTPTGTTYTFNALDCKKKYDFNITATIGTIPAERVVVKSPVILVNPATTPKLAPKNIGTVSVQNPSLIKFSVAEFGNKESNYIFYRSEGGAGNFKEVKQSTENFFEDKNVEPDKQQYCYKVEYQDQCGNKSELSPAFCSVFLTSERANTIDWTQFVIPTPDTFPVKYFVEVIDENGGVRTVDATADNTLSVKFQLDKILENPDAKGKANFRIRAVQEVKLPINGVITPFPFDAYSNVYTFITPAQIYVPTVFSPNEDGNNDVFVAKGRFIVEFNLEIYDRWGNVIFESKDLATGWNGTTVDGSTPAPAGNYGFKIFGLDPAGQKFSKVGSITLIR